MSVLQRVYTKRFIIHHSLYSSMFIMSVCLSLFVGKFAAPDMPFSHYIHLTEIEGSLLLYFVLSRSTCFLTDRHIYTLCKTERFHSYAISTIGSALGLLYHLPLSYICILFTQGVLLIVCTESLTVLVTEKLRENRRQLVEEYKTSISQCMLSVHGDPSQLLLLCYDRTCLHCCTIYFRTEVREISYSEYEQLFSGRLSATKPQPN